MVPDGWKAVRVGDIADVIRGASPRPKGDPRYYGGHVPRLLGADVSRDGKYVTPRIDYLTPEGAALSRPVPTGTLAIVCSGEVGRPAITAIDCCIHDGFLALINIDQQCEIEYLYEIFAFLKNSFYSSATHGATYSNLTTAILKDFTFPLPPKSEQKSIATILRCWDRAIHTVEKLIEKTVKQKAAMTQRFFDPVKATQELHIPYQRLCIQDIASVDRESLGSSTEPDYSFRYISLSDVEPGYISANLAKHTYSNAPSRARRIIRTRDILMSTVRPNLQGFARVTLEFDKCIASTGFAVLTVNEGFESDYLYHYLYSAHITGQLNSLVVGSNYPAVNSRDVKRLAIYCPDQRTQKRIATVLNCTDYALTNLRKQCRRLRAEKTALKQQLLTGKRRVRLGESSSDVNQAAAG